ncbi:MAG TPA: GAF domain-containing protein [Anaerolineae bacterium]|nr:GAF domain-containing protein [Anaerolineae bacterium]
MSFWFWVNIGAWGIVTILALALVLSVLSAGVRRVSNFYFVTFNLMQALSAVSAALSALMLWLERGDPVLPVELNTLGACFACVFLLMFAARYFEFAPRTLLIARIVSTIFLVACIMLTLPLFQHRIVLSLGLSPTGIPLNDFTPLGLGAAIIPLACLVGAAVLFWRRKESPGSRAMMSSVLILALGMVLGGLSNWPFPVFSIMTACGMAMLGYTVMNYQLFNPLQKLTTDLELRVAERTAALEKAYADLALQSAQSDAARAEAEQARQSAEAANQALQAQIWLVAGQAQLSQQLRATQDIPALAHNVIRQLCLYLDASVGALYLLQGQVLTLAGSYAYRPPATGPWCFTLGEGLIGQAAQNQQTLVLQDLPDHYMTVLSGMGQIAPRQLVIAPFLYNRQVVGALELGTLHEFSSAHLEFLTLVAESIAMTFYMAQAPALTG